VTNIFKITPKIGCLATGMLRILFKDYLIILADAKTMVTWLRMEAAEYKFDNGH
jgi:20S proteasome alpha/beta subunit